MESNFDSSTSQIPESDFTDSQSFDQDSHVPRRKMWGLLLVGIMIGTSVPYGVRYMQAASSDISADGRLTSHQAASEKSTVDFRKNFSIRMKALVRNLSFGSQDREKDSADSQRPVKKSKKLAKNTPEALAETPSSPELVTAPPIVAAADIKSPEISEAVTRKNKLESKKPKTKALAYPVERTPPKLPPPQEATRPEPSMLAAKPRAQETKPVIQAAKLEVRELVRESARPAPMIATPRAKTPSQSFAQVVNNARYSKEKLATCDKRCIIQATDANGNSLKVLIPGKLYADGLRKHLGTINISGQPKLVKNQQMLVAESITYNLVPQNIAKQVSPSGTGRLVNVFHRPAKSPSIPAVATGDLVPGMVIENRKQIPQEGDDEFDDSDTRLQSIDP